MGELPTEAGVLFEALRAWRRDEARRQSVPPYVIFADRTLAEIARARPGTTSALLSVNGVGTAKADRYGAAVLGIVASDQTPSSIPLLAARRGEVR